MAHATDVKPKPAAAAATKATTGRSNVPDYGPCIMSPEQRAQVEEIGMDLRSRQLALLQQMHLRRVWAPTPRLRSTSRPPAATWTCWAACTDSCSRTRSMRAGGSKRC